MSADLRQAIETLAAELEEPVVRIAILLPDRDMGRREGEDAERTRIAARLRAVLEQARAYMEGEWCGECRYGVVEDPPCCTQAAS